MITAQQLKAARALLGMDQRDLAQVADLSLPTIQRMEASEGVIRGNVIAGADFFPPLRFADQKPHSDE